MKYTEGKWQVKIDKEKFVPLPYIVAGRIRIAVFPIAWAEEKYAEELNANAQLIAAAPDLYEACKRLKKIIVESQGNTIWDANYDFIDKALRKAEGR